MNNTEELAISIRKLQIMTIISRAAVLGENSKSVYLFSSTLWALRRQDTTSHRITAKMTRRAPKPAARIIVNVCKDTESFSLSQKAIPVGLGTKIFSTNKRDT